PERVTGEPEPITPRRAALLDEAVVLHRREQPEHVVLRKSEPTRELGHSDLVLVAEHMQQPQRIRDRLDRVLALRLLRHRPESSTPQPAIEPVGSVATERGVHRTVGPEGRSASTPSVNGSFGEKPRGTRRVVLIAVAGSMSTGTCR